MSRFVAVLSCLAALAPAPVAGQVLRYGGDPGTARAYVREQHDRVIQTVNGRQRGTEIESFWRLKATVTAVSPEAVTLAIEHDSLAISDAAGASEPDLARLYGIPIEVVMSRRGQVREVTAPDSLPAVALRLDLAAAYRSFFPRLPDGGAGEGTAWSDTTTVTAHQNGLDLTVLRVSRYASKGWATQGARRVVRVDYEGTLTIEGSGEQQEAGIVLSGSGTASGGFSFDPEEGAFVVAGENTEMRMVVLVTAQGQNLLIPIVHNRAETIELIEPEAPAGN